MKDAIIPGILEEYDAQGYAVVKLPQFFDEDGDPVIDEVITLRSNKNSQNLPDQGDQVLIAFDHFGEPHLLGSSGCESQPIPYPVNPSNRQSANDLITALINDKGQAKLENATADLVSLLIDLITDLSTATVPNDGSGTPTPLSIAPTLVVMAAKAQTFKVT